MRGVLMIQHLFPPEPQMYVSPVRQRFDLPMLLRLGVLVGSFPETGEETKEMGSQLASHEL